VRRRKRKNEQKRMGVVGVLAVRFESVMRQKKSDPKRKEYANWFEF
jgi:hypothetical protein